MKKLNILLLTLSFALVSCEFDEGFEEMNVDPTASTSLDVNQKLYQVNTSTFIIELFFVFWGKLILVVSLLILAICVHLSEDEFG